MIRSYLCHEGLVTGVYLYTVLYRLLEWQHAGPLPQHAGASFRTPMSTKRKWDQAAPDAEEGAETPTKAVKLEEGKTASEAAAAAAAIAAKIAAQYAASGVPSGSGLKDPNDGEFTYDIDINDVRNRYMLTKGTTQQEVRRVRACGTAEG
jgi:hypothetical protein